MKVMPEIEKIIFNDPATIVIWSDGVKTVVKTHDEEFSPEHGLAMCIAKRYAGSRSAVKKMVEKRTSNISAHLYSRPVKIPAYRVGDKWYQIRGDSFHDLYTKHLTDYIKGDL